MGSEWVLVRCERLAVSDSGRALGCAAQVLCIQGFLACRKHADRVLLLVEMMAGSGFPCFKSARTVQNLRRRFHLNLTEAQVCMLHPVCPLQV